MVEASALGFWQSARMISSWRSSRSSFWRMISTRGCETAGARRAMVSSSVEGLSRISSMACSFPTKRSASQSSTCPRNPSARSATP